MKKETNRKRKLKWEILSFEMTARESRGGIFLFLIMVKSQKRTVPPDTGWVRFASDD